MRCLLAQYVLWWVGIHWRRVQCRVYVEQRWHWLCRLRHQYVQGNARQSAVLKLSTDGDLFGYRPDYFQL